MQCLESAEVQYFRGSDLRPSKGLVLDSLEQRMVEVMDLDHLTIHRWHIDQIRYCHSTHNEQPEDAITDQIRIPDMAPADAVRRSERLRNKPRQGYRNPSDHLDCGGCNNCELMWFVSLNWIIHNPNCVDVSIHFNSQSVLSLKLKLVLVRSIYYSLRYNSITTIQYATISQ